MSNFKENEKANAPKRKCFNNDSFMGFYKKTPREFMLSDWRNNFFGEISKDLLITYFQNNNLSWWGGKKPTGHILSSQIACLNYLFLIRSDKDAVLSIAQTICSDVVDVFIVENDKDDTKSYISFEVVSDNDYLNECVNEQYPPTRGNNCTSIDALIVAKHKNEKTILIPIEWKYTEWYGNTDKSTEDGKGNEKGSQKSGRIRLDRYTKLITESSQLRIKLEDYKSSVYFFEPFYQLMRQTLWAEQMIDAKNKMNERIKADDYIHVHVIPSENHDLLKDDLKTNRRRKAYSDGTIQGSMEEIWKSSLINPDKYKIITPSSLFANIDKNKYKNLIDYLTARYELP